MAVENLSADSAASRDALGQSRQLLINSSSSKAMGSGGRGTSWEIDLEGFFSVPFLSPAWAGRRT